ncbi:MAG: hypothetical protein KatS3mg035_0907 [Bacteroidia bacterium]|nr:MAG: hypothetical protein KatS3mg035_0907 [Bacteroidia bacterium]
MLLVVKNLADYVESNAKEIQGNLFRVRLVDFIDMKHELVLLADKIE